MEKYLRQDRIFSSYIVELPEGGNIIQLNNAGLLTQSEDTSNGGS